MTKEKVFMRCYFNSPLTYIIDRIHYFSSQYGNVMTIINFTNYNTEMVDGIEMSRPMYSLIIFYSKGKVTRRECIKLLEDAKLDASNPSSYVNRK